MGVLGPGGGGNATSQNPCETVDLRTNTVVSSTNTSTVGNTSTQTDCNAQGTCTTTASSGAADILTGIAADIVAGVAVFILFFASLILGIVGTLFNWTVYVTIFQFGNLVGNSAGMLAAWSILRDIGNIFLLFGFIFMGIGTILNLHSYSAKKALPALIIFAVLLNFSLLAAEGVIDASNVLSSLMYNQSGVCTEGESAKDCQNDHNYGIAGKVMENAGVSTIFSTDTIKGLATGSFSQALVFVGLAIFVTITAVVLLAGTLMLIARAVTLAFLIVLSPIGFAGMAIPFLHKMAAEWWSKLLSQAFFAPVYLLMIFISLKLMEGVKIALGVGTDPTTGLNTSLASLFLNTSNAGAAAVSNVSIGITFTLLTGFMVGALMVAKSMGATGASFAIKTAGGVVGTGTVGAAAFAGRRVIGGTANRIGNSIRSSAWAGDNPGLARLALAGTDATTKQSFDFRSSGVGKGIAGATGIDMGKVGKTAGHGFHGIEEKAVKEREDFQKSLKPSEKQKATAVELKTELEEARKLQKEHLKPFMDAIDTATAHLKDARKRNDKPQIENGKRNLQKAIQARNKALNPDKEDKSPEAEKSRQIANQVKTLDAQRKSFEKKAKQDRTEQHVEALEKGAHASPFSPYSLTVGPHADHAAVESIQKYEGMSGTEKALNELKKSLDTQTEHEDTHAEDEAAHNKFEERHAPAAGGHAPAAGHDDGHGGDTHH